MFQLFSHNVGAYTHWLAKALQDDRVWPFLSGTPSLDTRINMVDEFDQVHFISESGNAFASLHFDRRKYSARVKLFVVCLDGNLVAKRKDALAAYKFLLANGHIFNRFHVLHIDFAIHSTNLDAMRFYGKRVKPWGIEPKGLFDRRLQTWVDAYHYRFNDADLCAIAPVIRGKF
ncbi:MAG: hypothetical protein AB7K41_14465 [Bdellovibrionales bacterium]